MQYLNHFALVHLLRHQVTEMRGYYFSPWKLLLFIVYIEGWFWRFTDWQWEVYIYIYIYIQFKPLLPAERGMELNVRHWWLKLQNVVYLKDGGGRIVMQLCLVVEHSFPCKHSTRCIEEAELTWKFSQSIKSWGWNGIKNVNLLKNL